MKRLITTCLLLYSLFAFPMAHKVNLNEAIQQAVLKYGVRTEPELQGFFKQAKIAYPPKEVALLVFKKERRVELWAKDKNNPRWSHIHNYPMTAFSGRLGPKLKERDGQIPEGVYQLTSFNPFSIYHLSMMINYPNQFDRQKAIQERRKNLGGNIFIHGNAVSVGCVAVGDKAIDQLFLLSHRVGLNNVRLVIAPNDLRHHQPATPTYRQPRWLPELYHQIKLALEPFKTEQKTLYAWRD